MFTGRICQIRSACSPRRSLARPQEAALVRAPRRTPHAKAIVHEQLEAGGARIGKQVAVMGMGSPKHLHHAGAQTLGAGAHVQRLDGQPQSIDANHRRLTVAIEATPRTDRPRPGANSRQRWWCPGAVRCGCPSTLSGRPHALAQTARRSWGRAMAATEAPGSSHAASTRDLSSASWRRRGAPLICMVFTSDIGGHHPGRLQTCLRGQLSSNVSQHKGLPKRAADALRPQAV